MGDKNALWGNYLHSPKSILNYLLKLSSSTPIEFKIHNPAGSIMILIMMTMLVAIVISGLLIQGLFEFNGIFLSFVTYFNDPQAFIAKEIHLVLSYTMLIAISFHIVGVLYSSYIYKANLPMMMITGETTVFNKKKETQ